MFQTHEVQPTDNIEALILTSKAHNQRGGKVELCRKFFIVSLAFLV